MSCQAQTQATGREFTGKNSNQPSKLNEGGFVVLAKELTKGDP